MRQEQNMGNEIFLTLGLALFPVIAGIMGRIFRISFSLLQPVGLTIILLEAIVLLYISPHLIVDPSVFPLVVSVLLAGFCSILGHRESQVPSTTFTAIMVILGLGLGVLLSSGPSNTLFLLGILGCGMVFLVRTERNTIWSKLTILQTGFAIILSLISLFTENFLNVAAGLLLALTLLPLAPLHLPFLRILTKSPGILSGFWIVVMITLGLSELRNLQPILSEETIFFLQLLALGSAVYASLQCLGQQHIPSFLAFATVAHISLLWGLLDVFPEFSQWGIPFGVTLALIMSGLVLAFAFIQHRVGDHRLGFMPGLAIPMPRLGNVLIVLITLGLAVPLLPTFLGLVNMPSITTQDQPLFLALLLFLIVWLCSGFYFLKLLHQCAFGKERTDIPYTDLQGTEVVSLTTLILAASLGTFILYGIHH